MTYRQFCGSLMQYFSYIMARAI